MEITEGERGCDKGRIIRKDSRALVQQPNQDDIKPAPEIAALTVFQSTNTVWALSAALRRSIPGKKGCRHSATTWHAIM